MNKELYLHIGTHKTGTTALQAFFSANRNLLKSMGIVYPYDIIGGSEAGHYRLSWAIQKEAGIADERFPCDLQSSAKEWSFVLKQCDCPKALVSTEGFWDCRLEHLNRIIELTSGFTVKVIIYLRRQDHFEESWYNQLVKDYRCVNVPLTQGMFPIKEKFLQWAEVFGPKNIIVRPYEKHQFPKGTIFADFLCAVWDLELTDDYILPQNNFNPRLHRIALEYRRLVNLMPLSTQQKFMTLDSLLGISEILDKQKRINFPALSPQKRFELVCQYSDFYSEIARDYLGRNDGRLFYEHLSDPNEAWQPYDRLLTEDARFINDYLKKHHPDVLGIIFRGIHAAQKSEDPEVQEAAQRLLSGLSETSAFHESPVQTNFSQNNDKTTKMSQKELYIHIGTHKTGTTALQQFFFQNRKVLKQKGIEYPVDISGDAGHHRLGWSFHKEGGRPSNKFPGDLKSSKEEWNSLLASAGNKILISSETIYNCNLKNMQCIRDYAVEFHVKVIIYLRRQDSMTVSVSNQITKASDRKWTDYDKLPYKMNYIDCLDILKKKFGKENIIVRPYEKQQFYAGTIFADFLHHVFGLELTDEFKIPQGDFNRRLHRIALEYKRLVNFIPMTFEQKSNTLGPILEASSRFYKEHMPDPSILSPEKRLEIIQEYDEINQQIAHEYLGREDGRLFYGPLPDSNEDWKPYNELKEEDARYINRFLAENHPNTLAIIQQGILTAQSCEDESAQEAARLLLPGMFEKVNGAVDSNLGLGHKIAGRDLFRSRIKGTLLVRINNILLKITKRLRHMINNFYYKMKP